MGKHPAGWQPQTHASPTPPFPYLALTPQVQICHHHPRATPSVRHHKAAESRARTTAPARAHSSTPPRSLARLFIHRHKKTSMRRNYGSLNLAALDLSSSATIGDARFQESFMLAHDLAHLDVSSSSEHDDCASAVGYPIEYFAMMHDGDNEDDHYNDAYARADAPRCRKRSLSEHGLGAETRASSSASITSTCSTASTSSNASNVSTGISIPVTVTTAVKASSSSLQSSSYHSSVQKQHRLALDLPPRLVEQHHVELNALRCLSLNLMLSSSTPSGSSSGMMTMPQPSTSVPKVNSFEFEIGCQPQTDRVTAALLAGRRSSLPRNMIQSV